MPSDENRPSDALNPYAVALPSQENERTEVQNSFQRSLAGVPVLGSLMVIQGILQLVAGIAAGTYGLIIPQMGQLLQGQGNAQQAAFPPWLTWYSFGAFFALIVLGTLMIFSAVNVLRYRGRKLAIVSLFAGMLMIFTCYCFPTAIALTIYGLIVLLNPSVKLAFDWVEKGRTIHELTAASNPSR